MGPSVHGQGRLCVHRTSTVSRPWSSADTMALDAHSNSSAKSAGDKKLTISDVTSVSIQDDNMVRFRQSKGDVVQPLADALADGTNTAKILQLVLMTTGVTTAERARIAAHNTMVRVQSYPVARQALTDAQRADVVEALKLQDGQLDSGAGLTVADQWHLASTVVNEVAAVDTTSAGGLAADQIRAMTAKTGWKTFFAHWAPTLFVAHAAEAAPPVAAQQRSEPEAASNQEAKLARVVTMMEGLGDLSLEEAELLMNAASEAFLAAGLEDTAMTFMEDVTPAAVPQMLVKVKSLRVAEVAAVVKHLPARAIRAIQEVRSSRLQWQRKCQQWQDEIDDRWAPNHARDVRAQEESTLGNAREPLPVEGTPPTKKRYTIEDQKLLAEAAAIKAQEAKRQHDEQQKHARQRAEHEAQQERSVLPALNVDGLDTGLVFERVLEDTGTLGVVYLQNLRGKEVDDVVKKIKLMFAHSNHDVVWRQIQAACDPKTPDQLVQLVADAASISRVLDGKRKASLKLQDDKVSFITVLATEDFEVVARAATAFQRKPNGKATGTGPSVHISQADGMSVGFVWSVMPPFQATAPFVSLWGLGEAERPGCVVRFGDGTCAGPHQELQRARAAMVRELGLWGVKGTVRHGAEPVTRKAPERWSETMEVRGMGMVEADRAQLAVLEREFRRGTKTTKRAAGPKAAPGVPESVLREADVLRNAMPQTSGVEKASMEHCQAERYVQRAAGESLGSAERLGQRLVSWVAGGDAPDGPGAPQTVGHYRSGATTFGIVVDGAWHAKHPMLRVDLSAWNDAPQGTWHHDILTPDTRWWCW